jgi:hypothetical protein
VFFECILAVFEFRAISSLVCGMGIYWLVDQSHIWASRYCTVRDFPWLRQVFHGVSAGSYNICFNLLFLDGKVVQHVWLIMGAVDAYGYAGVGTCVGVLIGLVLGFIVGELAWCTIVCTAVASLLGASFDSRTKSVVVVQFRELDD